MSGWGTIFRINDVECMLVYSVIQFIGLPKDIARCNFEARCGMA